MQKLGELCKEKKEDDRNEERRKKKKATFDIRKQEKCKMM